MPLPTSATWQGAVDGPEQRVERGLTPGCPGPRPSVRAQACTDIPFRLFSHVLHPMVDNRGASTFGDGVQGTQNARRPCVVAFQGCRGRKSDQRVHEGKLVIEVPDTSETLAGQGDRFVGVPATHRQDGANIQYRRQKPRPGVSKHACGLTQEALRLADVAGRKGTPGQTAQSIATVRAFADVSRKLLVTSRDLSQRTGVGHPARRWR